MRACLAVCGSVSTWLSSYVPVWSPRLYLYFCLSLSFILPFCTLLRFYLLWTFLPLFLPLITVVCHYFSLCFWEWETLSWEVQKVFIFLNKWARVGKNTSLNECTVPANAFTVRRYAALCIPSYCKYWGLLVLRSEGTKKPSLLLHRLTATAICIRCTQQLAGIHSQEEASP
jgi:hypothetical protein